jgi:hypothetical protein
MFDLYWCREHDQYLARYGDDGYALVADGGHESGMSPTERAALAEARRRAKARGLVKAK